MKLDEATRAGNILDAVIKRFLQQLDHTYDQVGGIEMVPENALKGSYNILLTGIYKIHIEWLRRGLDLNKLSPKVQIEASDES